MQIIFEYAIASFMFSANRIRCSFTWLLICVACISLAGTQVGCRGGADTSDLSGQVSINGSPYQVTHYAASRFLEHAAMGPSPSSVDQVRRLGLPAWIENQLKLPPTTIATPDAIINHNNLDQVAAGIAYSHATSSLMNIFVGGEDQLRIRTSWALSNFLVVSDRKVQQYGISEYFNVLQRNAFGTYGNLLKSITLSPAMGFYLDNNQNNRFQLNENYGRELMQLFSVGLVQLNIDGTVKRDSAGKLVETYNQGDVIESTKSLTGWQTVPRANVVPNDANWANYNLPMVVLNTNNHDSSAKKVLGVTIPAGQTAEKDLDSLINILVAHPNTGPFVALRLIQNLTASDPSPAYVKRVATVFQQTSGDLRQVVKAILLDSEARLADVTNTTGSIGRIKEPHFLLVSVQRALGCRLALRVSWNANIAWTATQRPFNADSVFNFYPPNHRAPGSGLLAPEQKTLNSEEFSRRLGDFSGQLGREAALTDAGCDVATLRSSASTSKEALTLLLSDRLFRGAMSANLRQGLIDTTSDNNAYLSNPFALTGAMIDLIAITPSFGVTK